MGAVMEKVNRSKYGKDRAVNRQTYREKTKLRVAAKREDTEGIIAEATKFIMRRLK